MWRDGLARRFRGKGVVLMDFLEKVAKTLYVKCPHCFADINPTPPDNVFCWVEIPGEGVSGDAE